MPHNLSTRSTHSTVWLADLPVFAGSIIRNAESDAITNTFTIIHNQQQTAQATNKATQSQIPATTNNTLSNPTTRTLPVDTPINRTPLESRPNALVITNVQLGTGINNSLTIIPENKVIDPAQKTIHMVASHNGKDNGQNFIVRWYSITQQWLLDRMLSQKGFMTHRGDYYSTGELSCTMDIGAQSYLLADNIQNEIRFYNQNNIKCSYVDIVCHSMGGLIARHYSTIHPNKGKNVRKIIMVGTPNHGIYNAIDLMTGRAAQPG